MFPRRSGSLIGLDIGSNSVKLVELSKRNSSVMLESCGMEPVAANAALEPNTHTSATHISDAQSVGEAIKRLARRTRPKARSAAVAIGGSAAFTKVIETDASLSDEEMEGEIALQAAEHLPPILPMPPRNRLRSAAPERTRSDPGRSPAGGVPTGRCRTAGNRGVDGRAQGAGSRRRGIRAGARHGNGSNPGFCGAPDTAIFDIGANSHDALRSPPATSWCTHARQHSAADC